MKGIDISDRLALIGTEIANRKVQCHNPRCDYLSQHWRQPTWDRQETIDFVVEAEV